MRICLSLIIYHYFDTGSFFHDISKKLISAQSSPYCPPPYIRTNRTTTITISTKTTIITTTTTTIIIHPPHLNYYDDKKIPIGAILECTYYRYLHFHEDGTVRYSLTHKPPHEVIPHFIHHSKTTTINNNSSNDSTGNSTTTTTTSNISKNTSHTKKMKPPWQLP